MTLDIEAVSEIPSERREEFLTHFHRPWKTITYLTLFLTSPVNNTG